MKRLRVPLSVCAWGLVFIAATAQAQVVFTGLEHSALGDAILGVTPGGQLQVSNIGSSGQDGVSVDLGELTGVGLTVTNEGRDRLRITPTSQTTGRLGGMEVRNVGTDLEIYGVVPQTAGTYVFELTVTDNIGLTSFSAVSGGGLLGTLSYDSGIIPDEAAAAVLTGTSPGGVEHILVWAWSEDLGGAAGRRTAVVTMKPAPGTLFDVDHFNSLEVLSSVPGGTPPGSQDTSAELHLLRGFPVAITGTPTATYSQGGNQLTLSNIGSSGQDGVTIHARHDDDIVDEPLVAAIETAAETAGIAKKKRQYAPITITKELDKATPKLMEAAVKGKIKDNTLLQFKTTTQISGNNDIDLSLDATELGNASYQVDVYQHDILIASATGDETSNLRLNGLPPGVPVIDSLTMQYNESEWDFISIGHTSVLMPGSVTPTLLDGAEPVIVSYTLFDSTGDLASVELRYTGAGDVTITDISQVPEPAAMVLALAAIAGWALARRK